MVSSTTPRFGPRCPPVWESPFTSSSRTSCASCGRSCSFSALISAGERIPSSKRILVVASEESDFVIFIFRWFGGFGLRRLLLCWLKILYKSFPGAVARDNLDLLFRAGQTFLTNFDKIHPFFITNNQIFQRQLTRFHLFDDCLEPIHRSFKIQLCTGRFGLCAHRR